jgi:hypothetical protein
VNGAGLGLGEGEGLGDGLGDGLGLGEGLGDGEALALIEAILGDKDAIDGLTIFDETDMLGNNDLKLGLAQLEDTKL